MNDDKKITIRIPTELHEALVKAAEEDTRSLNSEIIVLLRKAIQDRKKSSPLPRAPRG